LSTGKEIFDEISVILGELLVNQNDEALRELAKSKHRNS